MSFEDRENKRKNVVTDIIGINSTPTPEPIEQAEPVKNAPVIPTPQKTEETLVRRTFYLRPEHIKAMAFEKAETNKDLSEIIRESLDLYFGDRMDQYR